MLSEYEQEAIEQLKSWREYIIKHKEKVNKANDIELYLRIVLNLITKLQKENELAKEQLKKQCEIADERNDLLVKVQELQKENKEKDEEISNLKIENNNAWEDWNNLEQASYEEELRLKEKIKEKDKTIDLMAEQLAGLTIWNNEKEEPLILYDKEEVKKYFERKVEDVKNKR